MSDTERVRLVGNDEKYFVFDAPGTIVPVYGHNFTVMEGQVLECDMHKDFVDNEVAAGRVVRINVESEKKSDADRQAEIDTQKENAKMLAGVDPSEIDEDGFSMDAETIFGVGSIDLLRVRLGKLKPKSKIIDFVSRRFNIKLAARLSKDDLVEEAIAIVQTALGDK
jgi:hypothetical protein